MSAGYSPQTVKPSKDNEKKPDDETDKKATNKEDGEAEEQKEQVQSLDDTAAKPPEEEPEDDPEAEIEREKERRRALQQRFWISALGFWKGGDRLAWPFTIGLVFLVLFTVAAQYGVNVWNRAIFDSLEKKETARKRLEKSQCIPVVSAHGYLC